MTNSEDRLHLDRRCLLTGAIGSLGMVAALPATAAQAPTEAAPTRRYPSNWPDLEPYGLADTRLDLWPRDDNSFILPLEMRPRDEEFGRLWMRDTYVNCFVVDGRAIYVATGTSRAPGLEKSAPWNDGIFVWVSSSLRGPWRLVDTTGIRPGAEKGKVWSPEFVGENRPGRTVVAPWQEYWYDDRFGKRGDVWAPEVHHFRGAWYIVACMGDHSRKVGSFMLVSEGGLEGPYRLVEGNLEKPFGESFIGGPGFVEPGAYHHIDGSLYTEDDDAWLVLHNDLYAKFRDDMEDIIPTTNLPKFQQSPYSPEPYLEGAYVLKHEGKYYLLHAAWNRTSTKHDGGTRFAYDPPGPGRTQYQYDTVVAVSDTFEGPYSKRWTAGVGTGHNNSSPTTAATRGRRSSATRTPATGPTRRASPTPPCPVSCGWNGPARRATACTPSAGTRVAPRRDYTTARKDRGPCTSSVDPKPRPTNPLTWTSCYVRTLTIATAWESPPSVRARPQRRTAETALARSTGCDTTFAGPGSDR